MAQSNAYLYNMPAGIPGAVNRVGGGGKLDIEAQFMDPPNPITAYGLAGPIDAGSGDFRAMAGGDTYAYGFLVRPFPTQATSASAYSGQLPLGTNNAPPAPPPGAVVDVLRSGYMTVLLYGAVAAAKGGQVYVRNAAADGTHPLGGVEASADGGNAIAIHATFTGPADANGNVEIAFNISVSP